MRERPILFSGAMVRTILADTKTQTRRIAKQTAGGHLKEPRGNRRWHPADPDAVLACPYGQPGDRLWVRETFYCDNAFYPDGVGVSCRWREVGGERVAIPIEEQRAEMVANDMYYRADGEPEFEGAEGPTPWRRSIHMPRWASRILLEVTAVRVERLQDISEADCIAEGCAGGHGAIPGYAYACTPLEHYHWLWNSINGAGAWEANPWVWVVEFKRVEADHA